MSTPTSDIKIMLDREMEPELMAAAVADGHKNMTAHVTALVKADLERRRGEAKQPDPATTTAAAAV